MKIHCQEQKVCDAYNQTIHVPSLNDGLASDEVWFGYTVAEGFALNILTVTMARSVFSVKIFHYIITTLRSISFQAEET
jgi:hypothetical protein